MKFKSKRFIPRMIFFILFLLFQKTYGAGPVLLIEDQGWMGERAAETLESNKTELFIGKPRGNSTAGLQTGVVEVFPLPSLGTLIDYNQNQIIQKVESPLLNQGPIRFGSAISVNNQWLVISSPGASQGAGRVDIYQKINSLWAHHQALVPQGPGVSGFGESLSLYGDELIVGAPLSVNGGAAYIYELNLAQQWTQTAQLNHVLSTPSVVNQFSRFGRSVAIRDGVAVVGDPYAFGDPRSGNLQIHRSGRVEVFTKQIGGNWASETDLVVDEIRFASPLNPQFGYSYAIGNSVAIGEDRIVFSAHGYSNGVGAVYQFSRVNGVWGLHEDFFVLAPSAGQGSYFGQRIKLEGRYLLASRGSISIDQVDAFDLGPLGATTFTHLRNDQLTGLSSFADKASKSFVYNKGYVYIGIPERGTVQNGVGQIFVFEAPFAPSQDFCLSLPNSTGSGGLLESWGSNSFSLSGLVLKASGLPPFTYAALRVSRQQASPTSYGSGANCLGAPITMLSAQQADSTGEVNFGLSLADLATQIPGGLVPGDEIFIQAAYRDLTGFNATQGISLVLVE